MRYWVYGRDGATGKTAEPLFLKADIARAHLDIFGVSGRHGYRWPARRLSGEFPRTRRVQASRRNYVLRIRRVQSSRAMRLRVGEAWDS